MLQFDIHRIYHGLKDKIIEAGRGRKDKVVKVDLHVYDTILTTHKQKSGLSVNVSNSSIRLIRF